MTGSLKNGVIWRFSLNFIFLNISVELVFWHAWVPCCSALDPGLCFQTLFFPFEGFFKSGFSQPAGSIELGFPSGFFFFFSAELLVLYLKI